ncbi:cadherin EGF LAG seven-pass G-type receptor 1 [Patella vulgata]|uniref:cadherin EGF LAG seven-pass G-type receptor 1 n=1 Tax=Patella vulgata TaxID=6465 RepID=UPI0021805075|nr:cadherin EGF LAG seven-pass G-type receptor 1 [Patella vulgata]
MCLKMEHKLLCLFFLIGSLSLSSCQNAAPQFRTLARDGIDGNLYDRLTVKGIEENLPIGSVLGKLSCTDADGDAITYQGEGQTLLVNATGTVFMNRLLDRENSPANSVSNTGARILVHKFSCMDNQLTATADIEITITDKNDNAPTFLSSTAYSGRIREDAVPGITTLLPGLVIQVVDTDRGLNAVVDISCFADDVQAEEACDYFGVTSIQTGEGRYNSTIYLKKQVDYETQRGYTMTLLAKDRGVAGEKRFNSTANVLIEVQDTQDSPPEFLNVPLTIYVQENIAIGTSLTPSISAQDQDQGAPRAVDISIVNDTKGLFRMGPSTPIDVTNKAYQASVLTRQPIDREELQGRYIFQVRAEELYPNGTKSGIFEDSDVTVNILDENDNQPTFQNTNYNVNLTEMDSNGTQTNSQVPNLNIQVTDKDDSSNANYYVTIGRQTYPGAFRVSPSDNSTGTTAVNMLILNSDFLDFDNPNYRRQIVVIEARELTSSQSTPKTSSATVTINLLDLNDNSPIFAQAQYERTLREDSAINTPIITITATDKDEGENGRITYSLRGTDLEVFNLNSATGEIRLRQTLDYETQTEYPVILVARDNGLPPRESTKTFTLKVSDFNDLGPQFIQDSYQTYVFETSLQLQPAVTVQATDPEDPTGVVTYRIIAGNINNAFSIDPNSGVLTLTKNIDYDDTPGQSGKIELIVEASDRGLNGEAGLQTNTTVTVNVQVS